MKLIKQSFVIEDPATSEQVDSMLYRIEQAGRTCYKTEHKAGMLQSHNFIKYIIDSGHESVIEHEKATVRIICDRGISHEIVRHRIASYSQESTRYCNYSKDKFGNELTFIDPSETFGWTKEDLNWNLWMSAIKQAELSYLELIKNGIPPEQARNVLPNSLKTELVMTMNFREWRRFFILRTSQAAHPQIKELAKAMLKKFQILIPIIFDNIGNNNDN